jgi:SAM-dependent methyltransferase
MSTGPRRRRESFDAVADDYARYRPAPPAPVVDAVCASGGLGPGTRVLEIGCGAGQLTVALGQRGVDVTAVELGPRLAARAERNLTGCPNARVVIAAFEEWPLPARPFDAVVSANAFHWLDPEIRFVKTATALRVGGSLVIVVVHHVRGGTSAFFDANQRHYVGWGLSEAPQRPPTRADLRGSFPELDTLPAFGSVRRRWFEVPVRSTTEEYLGWLRTDSLVNAVDPVARRGFLADMARLIDTEFDGSVVRNWVHEVITAVRVPAGAGAAPSAAPGG